MRLVWEGGGCFEDGGVDLVGKFEIGVGFLDLLVVMEMVSWFGFLVLLFNRLKGFKVVIF